MAWQPHYSGHTLPPPLKEDTQVELFLFFQPFGFIENKRTSSKLLTLCVVILNQVLNKTRRHLSTPLSTPD